MKTQKILLVVFSLLVVIGGWRYQARAGQSAKETGFEPTPSFYIRGRTIIVTPERDLPMVFGMGAAPTIDSKTLNHSIDNPHLSKIYPPPTSGRLTTTRSTHALTDTISIETINRHLMFQSGIMNR